MVHHFADRLTAAVRRTKTPALVGIDPRLANLPAPLQPNDDSPSPEQIATAFLEFSHGHCPFLSCSRLKRRAILSAIS